MQNLKPMNSAVSLRKRLLNLFPIKILKEYFNEKGNTEDVINSIVGSKRASDVNTFVLSNQAVTKQNIYVLSLRNRFQESWLEDFPFAIVGRYQNGNKLNLLVYQSVKYTIYVSEPNEIVDLSFIQPIVVQIENTRLIIRFTKLEKNVSSYFEEDRVPRRASITNDEQDSLEILLSFFRGHTGVARLDLNKGLKHLWQNNYVDCHKIQYRESHSVSTTTMDEMYTYRERYPERYEEIITRPITKSIFKTLRDDDYLCEGFTIDPSIGEISITKFPKNLNQIDHVLDEILRNN